MDTLLTVQPGNMYIIASHYFINFQILTAPFLDPVNRRRSDESKVIEVISSSPGAVKQKGIAGHQKGIAGR